MKHNLLKSVIISVILLTGVSNAWGVDRIYLKLNSWSTSDGDRYAARFYNDNGKEYWQNMYETSISNVLACDLPTDGITYNKVIFVRLNPSGSDSSNGGNNWNNKWNQSGDITFQKNKLCTAGSNWDSWGGSWSTITWYITGSFNDWKTNNSETSYTLNANTTYEFKVYSPQVGYFSNEGTMNRGNHSNWDMFANVGNCTLTTDIAGTYIFTYNGDKMNVTYPEECLLGGNFVDDWKTTYSIHNKSVTIKNLKAGTYEFKIHRYDATSDYWVSNDGTMTRENCSDWTMYDDVNKNCKITADFDGDYTFAYNRSTGKLSVTYPTAYKVTYDVGTNKGTASVTTSPNITSGSFALPSTSITFSKGATKEGYTWKGWYSNEAGTGTNFGNGATYTSTNRKGDISVYACYDLITYNITYNLNGGTGATNTTYNVESATITLPTAPTKTGYTFAGWYDNVNLTDNTVTQVAKGSTGHKEFWAKWNANQYTITWNANGGSVTPASSTYTYDGAAVTLPTPTRNGYTFNGWYTAASGGTKITEIGTTNKPASNTTYYARWTENSYTVNIVANPAGAAKTLTLGSQQVGINPVNISTSPNIGYQFKNWTATAGITITNPNSANTAIKATKAGTVTANFEEKFTTIYLEPTGYWNSHTPQYVAHVWGSGEDNIIMTGVGDAPYKYYKAEVPYGYTNVVFFRKKSDGSELWNQTADLTIPKDNKTLYEIKSTGDGTTTKAIGDWKAANLVYTITLGYCDFGTYGIKYNGQSYFSKQPNENVTIDVPAGAQIEILEGQPHSNAYRGDVVKKKPTNEKLTTGQALTINGDVTLDDNFITTTEHVVYLGIPDAINTTEIWAKADKANFIYTWDTYASYGLVASTRSFRIDALGITYYEFTIPEERHSFRFQRKSSLNDKGTPHCESVSLEHEIPLTEVNCFTLKNEKDGNNRYKGTWGALPAQQGDHRLLYIEQKVELENGHPNTIVTKAHPSDIIRQGDTRTIYSLHIYNKVENDENGMNDPEILLQECTGYNGVNPIWTTRERHMVFGPLHANFGMAAMPGRRNADGDPDAVLRYDNGIEKIKNDINTTDPRFVDDQASGVWNFIVTRDGSKNFEALDLTQTARYTGDYYVRTDCADGGWDMYTAGDNHMHFSAVSKAHSNYSHYFCKWVGEANVNVKYTIANDYGIAISDTLEADKTDLWGEELANKMVGDNQLLPAKANVRFSWNEKTNGLHRAYIAGATNAEDRFLVLGGKTGQIYNAAGQSLTEGANNSDRYGLKANEEIFSDIENWVYQTDVQITPGAELQVTAKYNNQVQYFVGKEGVFNNTILQGSGTEKYLVRLLYDFKTNELISAYVPGASKDVDQISTNLMIIRQNYNEAKQLVFNNGDMSTRDNRKAYGVIEFTEDYLTDPNIQYLKRCLYWVSFPFDVNLSEAFGSLVYGKHWLIQEYDGARRAAEGLWKESESFWELHWEPNITLEAGLGYVIEIDINQMIKDNIINTTDDKQQIAALYFPASTPITNEIINQKSYTVNILAHKCNIVHTGDFGDRTIRDSHWNVIGVPSYVNTGATFSDQTFALNNVVKYYYQWDGEVDKYTAMEADEQAYDFQSMYAYMVQYAGDITWNSVLLDEKPAQIAAKKNPETSEHAMRLELQQGNGILDKTFVRLQDDVVTPAFDFNYDLCKITNKGANIYSIITAETSPVEVAANVLPIEETIIPLGVKTDKAGEYTFAMPEGTDGIVVELIDYETNTRTNMLLSDYTVTLPKGTNDTRFALHVKPSKVVTGVENIGNSENGLNGETVKKYLIDGVLYLQKGNLLYDAQGRCVQ